MTKRNVVMASAPTSSAARSQAWISMVRFTLNHNISAPELGRSAAVKAVTRREGPPAGPPKPHRSCGWLS